MEARTQRKICGAVLTLAASAFGVDRWMIGPGPSEAQASAYAVAGVAEGPRTPSRPDRPANADADGTTQAKKGHSLADRLRAAAEAQKLTSDEVGDAFQRSAKWAPKPAAKAATTPAPPPVDLAAQFQAQHKLTAIMTGTGGQGGMAVVSGKALRPGQSLAGFTLLEVREHSAVFTRDGKSVELRLGTP